MRETLKTKYSTDVSDLGFSSPSERPLKEDSRGVKLALPVALFALAWGLSTGLIWAGMVADVPVGDRASEFLVDSPLRAWAFPFSDAIVAVIVLVRGYLSLSAGIQVATFASFVISLLFSIPLGIAHGAILGGMAVAVRAALRRLPRRPRS